MMVIRPVVAEDLAGLMTLAGETGGGLTSLPADEKTLAARIERSQQTWRGEQPKANRAMFSCLKRPAAARWWGFALSKLRWVERSPVQLPRGDAGSCLKGAECLQRAPTLFLSNDHTGSSELCTLFLDPARRKEGNGYLLSKSRFMFMAAFREHFNEKSWRRCAA